MRKKSITATAAGGYTQIPGSCAGCGSRPQFHHNFFQVTGYIRQHQLFQLLIVGIIVAAKIVAVPEYPFCLPGFNAVLELFRKYFRIGGGFKSFGSDY